jgi:5-methylcytosine-specific restriction enzyme A
MLVSCRYCGRIHEKSHICQSKTKRTKDNSALAVKFRNTNAWKKKSAEIRKRDNFLCQVCILENKYIFHKIEVHHIKSIEKAFWKRLDNFNLITLCPSCHKEADNSKISGNFLLDLAAKQEKMRNAL